MLPYLIITIAVLAFSFLDMMETNRGVKSGLFVLLFLILVCFVGLRDNIGSDWPTYAEIFNFEKTNEPSPHHVELGYVLLVRLIQQIRLSFNSLILVMAIISLSVKFIAIKKISPLSFIPVLYYVSYYLVEYEMSGIRQAVAMGFAMLSLVYVQKRTLLPFLMCIVLGALFHISILIFIPIYYFNKLVFSNNAYLAITTVSLLFVFTNASDVLLNLISVIPLGAFAISKLTSYSQSNVVVGLTLGHVPYILFAIIFIYYRRIVNNRFYDTILNGFIIGLFLSFVFSGSLSVLNRLTYYYLLLGGILFSYILYHTQYKINKFIIFSMLSFFAIIKIVDAVSDDEEHVYVPYETVSSINQFISK